ncbi:AAA family ATPase [Gordonia phthalatica]|uniref:ATPase n=1 Tax=Gordonia phthalatica TaxID=1136941 RepID=A0A0N9N2E6_9ACTN|nr:ATP-binding protein [Gordonia phthalatica]ALG84382.1 ATPase [Gordonia phthalatica]
MRPESTEHTNSPFRPGYSRPPLIFGGHQDEIEEFTEVFQHYDFGENQSVLISGLRGAGKTSMLSRLQDIAETHGWLTIRDDASKGLMDRVVGSTIPTIVNSLSDSEQTRLKSLSILNVGIELEIADRSRTVAPSLRSDLVAISQATDNRGILILIDEVHSSKVRLRELSRFALEISHAMSTGANIMVAFAGVKVDLDQLMEQPHMTFLRRSREVDFRRLSIGETRRVLRETTQVGGRTLAPDAETHLVKISQGYPYLVQLAGDYAWRNNPTSDTISLVDAKVAQGKAKKAIESRVIKKVYDDLSEMDQEFLRAMAPDDGRTKISSIVSRMEKSDQYVQVYKQRLLDSGYVESTSHGYVEFSLPYLRDYVRSTMEPHPAESSGLSEWRAFPPPAP